jgi:retron-type reverse transcriptase
MVEHAKRKKDNLFVFFLDYSKAFDRVNRVKLMYKLINVLPAHYWLALNNYYSTTKIRIQGRANEMSEPIETSIGTKQGGPFSPDAFNYYIDDLLIQLENTDHIYKIKNIPLGLIVYADDTTIACSTKKSAKSALNLVENYCDAHDILINESKTKWMCFNTNSKGPFEINGQALERVKQF